MKKLAIVLFLLLPLTAFATPTSWDFTNSILQPLRSMWTNEVKIPYLTATSTNASTFAGGLRVNASSTIGAGTNAGGLTVAGRATTSSLIVGSLGNDDIFPFNSTHFSDNNALNVTNEVAFNFRCDGAQAGTQGSCANIISNGVMSGTNNAVLQLHAHNTGSSNGWVLRLESEDPQVGLIHFEDLNENEVGYIDSTGKFYTEGGLWALASSTIGTGAQAGGLTVAGGATTTGNLLVQGNATSTNLFSTTASSTNLFASIANLVVGTFGRATSTNFFATTASSTNLFSTNASTTNLLAGRATTTSLFATTASSTNLYASFASTSHFSVAGNTYLTSLATGCITSTGGLLSSTGAVCGGSSDTNWSFTPGTAYLRPATTTNGLWVSASSTIGDGTQIGGLTLSGGATTTLAHYFATNIGIGSTTPTARVGVTAVVNAATPVFAATGYDNDAQYSPLVFSDEVGLVDFAIYKDGSTNSIGKVGFGSSSPRTQLTVTGPGTAIVTLGLTTGNPGQDSLLGGIDFWNTDATGDSPQVGANINSYTYVSTGNGGYLTFGTASGATGVEGASPVERMRINGDGNIGIGTTTPEAPLTVYTTVPAGMVFYRPSAGNSSIEYRNLLGTFFAGISQTGEFGIGPTNNLNSTANFRMSTTTGRITLNTMMGVDAPGTIQIGRTDSGSRFHEIRSQVSVTNASNWMEFNLNQGTATTSIMRLLGTGNVGIGTTSPMSMLAVAGTTTVQNINATSTSATSRFDGILQVITRFIGVISAAFTPSVAGEMGIDSTSGQLKWFDGQKVQVVTGTSSPAFSISSTTQDASGKTYNAATTSLLMKNDPEAFSLAGWYCRASSTGAVNVRFGDGTNWTNIGVCGTTGAFIAASSNNTFTAFEDFITQISATSAVPSRVIVTTVINKTAD